MSCLNSKSILDDPWEPDYEPNMNIELLDFYDTIYEDKTFCFRRDELRSLMTTDTYQTAKWYIDPIYKKQGFIFNDDGWVIDPDHPEEKYALGYPSLVEKYIRIPINEDLQFYVLQQNLETILFMDNRDFIGIVIDQTRVGNDYTMSGSHGQLPEVQIHYLVPRNMYEEAPDLVAQQIYNTIFALKYGDELQATIQAAKYLQDDLAKLDSQGFYDTPLNPSQNYFHSENRYTTPLRSSIHTPIHTPIRTPIRTPSINRTPIRSLWRSSHENIDMAPDSLSPRRSQDHLDFD